MTRKKASVSILLPLAVAGLAFGIWKRLANRSKLSNLERERTNIG